MMEQVSDVGTRVGIAVAILVIGYLVSRVVRLVLRAVLSRKQTRSFAYVMSTLGSWAVFMVFAMVATVVVFPTVAPVDLLAGLGFFSVAVGFAFQDILENTLAGVLLLFRQPFESGDQIEVLGQTGTVEGITIRETRIKTFDGELVIIPNRDVYKNTIHVQTFYPTRRLAFVVGVAYEADVREVCDVIVDALVSVDGVTDNPAPEALVAELGVSTVNIQARFWTDPRQQEGRVMLDLAIKAVKEALDAGDFEMPADIIALQATPSFKAALQGEGEVTPGGGLVRQSR